jgi:probable F420-dependent oxidoreductase
MADIGFGAFYLTTPDVHPGEFARRIEDLGFDGFWAGESPNNRSAAYDLLTVLPFAAAATSRITVGADVLLTPLHHPAWLAKALGTLDVLSAGRTIATLGVGGEYAKQFDLFGIPVSERGRRTDEAIEVIRELWTKPEADYHGRFFDFEGISMKPKPLQSPHPPLWIGGRPGGVETAPDGQTRYKSKVGAIRRAGTYGDGWCPYYVTPEAYKDSVAAVTDVANKLDRDISTMQWALTTFWLIRDSYDEALDVAKAQKRYGRDLGEGVGRYDLLGNPKDIIRRLEQYIEAGVRYFICNWSCSKDEIPGHLETIARDVIPHFR